MITLRSRHAAIRWMSILMLVGLLTSNLGPAPQVAYAVGQPPANPVVATQNLIPSPTPSVPRQGNPLTGEEPRLDYNAATGKLSFIGAEPGNPILVGDMQMLEAQPEAQARAILSYYAPQLGLKDVTSELSLLSTWQEGDRQMTRFQQIYRGLPVLGGELVVNATLEGGLLSINGEIAPGLELPITPKVSAEAARQAALAAMARWYRLEPNELTASQPELWIYDSRLLQPDGRPAVLVWRLEITSTETTRPLNELILVEAELGGIRLHFNQVDAAWQTQVEPPTPEPTAVPTVEPTVTPFKTQALTETPTETVVATPTETATPTEIPAETASPALKAAGTGDNGSDVNALGTTWYVNEAGGNDTNDCLSSATPCWTINGAINKAATGDTILVAQGRYRYRSGGTYSNVVVYITKNLSILGGWDSNFNTQTGYSTIDGDNTYRGIGNGAVALLSRFIIKNCMEYGISSSNYLTINSSFIIDNKDNYSGGGIESSGSLVINNSTIARNSASSGGGLSLHGMAIIRNSTITDNFATYDGGGIYNSSPSYASNVTIINSIITNNRANRAGENFWGILNNSNYNIYGNMPDTITPGPADHFNTRHQMSPFPIGALGYYVPLIGGLAIDGGDPTACLPIDQRGISRPQGDGCDIGAYEYVLSSGQATAFGYGGGSNQFTLPNTPFSTPLIVYVVDNQDYPVSGVSITFTAPDSGPSGTFVNSGTNTITVLSDANGLATSTVIANSQVGTYTVNATASGLSGSVVFSLANKAWYVSPTGDDANDCKTSFTPCLTINGAIGKATDGDQILVAQGTYTGSGTEVVTITKSVSLFGGWDSSFTTQTDYSTIDGQNSRRGLYIAGEIGQPLKQISLSHFIIENGSTGGIVARANLTIDNSIIRNNVSGNGGGIYTTSGSLTLNNSIVSDNLATGPVGNYGYGGGIYAYYSSVTLNNSTISGNHAESAPTFSAGQGGGIYADNAKLTITNSTFYYNTATSYGGGIYTRGDVLDFPATINNSTIIYNSATREGGGIRESSDADMIIRNSIIANNVVYTSDGVDCKGRINISDHNLIQNGGNCERVSETGAVSGDPQLYASASGMPPAYQIKFGSPARDAGNPATCANLDQRGISRPFGSSCDIGAIEYSSGIEPYYFTIIGDSNRYVGPGAILSPNLQVLVSDSKYLPVPGITVTFASPTSGAGGSFSNTAGASTTAVTDVDGIATASIFTANLQEGLYSITASISELPTPLIFAMQNVVIYRTYTMDQSGNDNGLPGTFLCDQSSSVCTNGVNLDADHAHQFAFGVYNFYKLKNARNSIDNHGLPLISSVDYGLNYDNAFWNGTQMVYGAGYPAADDVVGHELTHGVTDYESNLFYYYQSGAINESLSDIWGELYDQSNGQGTDTPAVKWLLGEDAPGGANRSLSNPPAYGDPDAMTHANYFIGDTDSGGVHTNSGVNNKAAYLLVDGGSLNGVTVSPIGANKTLAVYYEAQTNLLVSGSNYADLYQILYQACLNLVGGSDGVTLSDCQQVRNATEAVRMNAQPANSPDFNSDAPICGTGYQAADLFYDNLETNGDNWTSGALSGTDHWWYGKLSNSHSGTHSLYANDWPVQVTDSFVMTANAITLPAGAYLRFDHTYGFEDYQGENFDGGVVEYSLNGGSSWLDAASLFDFRGYNGSLSTAYQNPLKGRQAFVADSHGYVSSRLNLQSLAGKSVIFRWRMGLDESGYDQGWWLDDVQVYTCQKGAVGLTVSGFPSPATPGASGSFTVTAKTSDGLVATGYTGTVTFTSNDPQAVLPIQYTFQPGDAGTKTLSATLMTPGSGRTITVTDTRVSSITGSQSGITVNLIAPVAFGKLLPGLGAVAVSSAPLLSWEASPAADHYEYCYQAGEAGSCTSWINNGSATSIRLRALSPSTTYFWQVRAVNALATTYANENTEWNFTTADNDFVENATTLLIPFTFIQDTALAGKGPTDPALAKCGLAAGEASVWYKFAPITTTTLNLDTFGSNYDTQIGIFSGSPDSLVEAVCNDDASGTQQSALSLRVMAGTTYYVVISHYAGEPKILSGGEIGSTDLTTQAGGTLKLNVTTFADARSNHKYWRYIEGFYSRGITVGCSQNPLSYCADNSVTRAAMAVFMLKTKNGTAYPPPASTGIFTDVPFPGKEWMQPYVEDWYRQGITVGCSQNPRMYCPENTITRAAISVFILKLKYGNDYVPPASTSIFTDVPFPGKEWMQPYVEEAYNKGFTEACSTSPLRFCPEAAVTRGDMAAFLSRAFDIVPKP